MEGMIFVPVRDTKTTNDPIHAVGVNCDHMKGRGVVISLYPACREGAGYSLVITAGTYRTVEPMPRLNRKRLEAIQSLTRNEISMETGRAWDLVLEACRAWKLEVETATANV